MVAPLHGHAPPLAVRFISVLNGVGLFLGGVVLEGLLGRAWLGALFVIGALGGSIASVLINDPGTVSVGASGANHGPARGGDGGELPPPAGAPRPDPDARP